MQMMRATLALLTVQMLGKVIVLMLDAISEIGAPLLFYLLKAFDQGQSQIGFFFSKRPILLMSARHALSYHLI